MKSSIAKCRLTNRNNSISALQTFIYFCCLILISTSVSGQTLFTYGKHAVSKQEFLNAYNKNNSDSNVQRMSYEEYLELYTRFKLKVQSALDEGMDTTAEQKNELESIRYQLAENYIKDDASIKLLVDEAFDRSQKDIHVSFIYVPYFPQIAEK